MDYVGIGVNVGRIDAKMIVSSVIELWLFDDHSDADDIKTRLMK